MDVKKHRVVAVLAIALACPALAAPEETAKPQAAPTLKNDAGAKAAEQRPELAAVRQWFAELDDPDANVREKARVSLMGMQRRNLPAFQKLVQDSRPLAPAQAAVLREIVMHVYLAGEEYDTTGAQGFLGVRMQETDVRLPGAHGADRASQAVGVVIVERMPGWVGSRMLLDGDVILGVVERQDVRLQSVTDFQELVQSITPGSTVHFQVLRQGQVARIPVTLDARPFGVEQFQLTDLIQRRQRKAEDYWNSTFGPAVKEGVG